MPEENVELNDVLSFIGKEQERVTKKHENKTFQVWKQSIKETPLYIGTCFGLIYKKKKFLVTAKHVMDEVQKDKSYPLIVHKSGIVYELKPELLLTTIINEEIDIYLIEIETTEFPLDYFYELKHNLINANNKHQTLIVSIGYPYSKNKKRIRANNTPEKMFAVYLAGVIIDDEKIYSNLKLNSQEYILSEHNKKKSLGKDFKRINGIKENGMSGAPVFSYLSIENPVTSKDELLGVLTMKKGHYVAYIKIGEVINLIDNQ